MRLRTDDTYRMPAPEGGIERAVARGRSLRHRRHAALAGLASTTVAAVVAVASLSGTSLRNDSLQVADTPTAAPTATQSSLASVIAPGNPGPAADTGPTSPQADHAVPPPIASPTPRSTPPPPEPGMTRTYDKVPVNVGGHFCDSGVGIHGVDKATICGWGSVDPTQADSRHVMPVSAVLCEDQAEVGPMTVHYATDREVDFAVYQGSRLVWRWSASRPPARRAAHTLSLDPGRCWTWATSWRAVDAKGKALRGDFSLVTTWFPSEFSQTERRDFTI